MRIIYGINPIIEALNSHPEYFKDILIVRGRGGKAGEEIKELAKETLKLSCEIGIPKGITGVQEDPSLATVAGLALEGVDFGEEEGILGLTKGWFSKLRKMLKLFC